MNLVFDFFSYLFKPSPGKDFFYYIPLAILTIALIVFAIVLFLLVKKAKDDKAFRRLFRVYPRRLITVGLCLGFYLFFRYTQVPFLSTRIVLYVILAITVLILAFMGNTYLNKYPQEKKKYHEQEEKNKYIPRKNKKK